MTDTPPPVDPVPEPSSTSPGASTPGATPTPAATPVSGTIPDPADVEKNKVFAVLAYLGILVLVPILAAKDSPFARYHANQGLILLICAIAGGFAFGIVSLITAFIPMAGACIACVLWLSFIGTVLTFAIMGIFNAVNGRMRPLPVIGGFTILK